MKFQGGHSEQDKNLQPGYTVSVHGFISQTQKKMCPKHSEKDSLYNLI